MVWDNEEHIIIPKRYYAFKHFSTLSSKGFIRISHTHLESELYVTTFLNPNENQLVTHVFNSGDQSIPMTIEIPHNTSEIFRYTTDASLNFNKTEIDVIDNHRYIETDLTRKSISSFVFDLSSTLNKQSQEIEPITIFPNPTSGLIFLSGSYSEIKCSVFLFLENNYFNKQFQMKKT